MPRKSAVKASAAAASAAVQAAATTSEQAELGTLTIAIDSTTTTTSSSSVSAPRAQRERKARTVYSPSTPAKRPTTKQTAEQDGQQKTPLMAKKKVGRPARASSKAAVKPQQNDVHSSEDTDTTTAQESGAIPEYKKLEGRIKGQTTTFQCSQVKRLRYQLAFVEAYEAEGWRRASREKLKPSKELETANQKILKDKRAVVATLAELQRANASDTQYPQLVAAAGGIGGTELLLPEDIYCSRCGDTDADEDNDILICDSEGCARAYHQKCQSPWFKTEDIPVGDELWYCEVCLAIFNSLKLINSAFGTTYDTVAEVFPELEGEEKRAQRGGGDDLDGGDEDDDEEDDDDFVADEDEDEDGEAADTSDESESEDSEASGGMQPIEEAEVESEVSDQELKYLRKADVIDPNSRSMRSNSKKMTKSSGQKEAGVVSSSFLGQKAAKLDAKSGKIVFGVIVEEQGNQSDSGESSQWQVVYYNDTMEMLSHEQVLAAIALAKEHMRELEKQDVRGDNTFVNDPKLILHGKRKRTQVNYRELNDAMFAGKADSDEEADADAPGGADGAFLDEDDEDYVPELKSTKKSKGSSKAGEEPEVTDDDTATTSKRSRRERKNVDYHALNEGLVGY